MRFDLEDKKGYFVKKLLKLKNICSTRYLGLNSSVKFVFFMQNTVKFEVYV